MPTILHDSVFNEIRGTPEEDPTKNDDNSDVLMYDEKNGPLPNEVSKAPVVAIHPAPSIDVPELQFKPKFPIYKNESVSKLRTFIMSIDNEDSLK